MYRDLSDEQLVAMAVSNDQEAFGEIVRRWERRIFALCFGMLTREDEARDAAQETFIAAFKNLKNFRGEAKVSSWLHRIAVNQCLTTKRRNRTRSEEYLDDETNEAERVFILLSYVSIERDRTGRRLACSTCSRFPSGRTSTGDRDERIRGSDISGDFRHTRCAAEHGEKPVIYCA